MATPLAPGVYFEIARPPAPEAELRSDIAGFVGRARRGPIGQAVRVQEWREFERVFGGLDARSTTSYAVRSYFENGGQVAYMMRVAGPAVGWAGANWPDAPGDPLLPGHRVALPSGEVRSKAFIADLSTQGLAGEQQSASRIAIRAASAGGWASGAQVRVSYRRQGALGGAEVDIITRVSGEPVESLRALPASIAGLAPLPNLVPEFDPLHLVDVVNSVSRFIRLVIQPPELVPPAATPGPNRLDWLITLSGGADDAPRVADYLAAIDGMSRQPEVALLAFPDLYTDLPFDFDPNATPAIQPSMQVLRHAVTEAERLHERMVLVDLPLDDASATVPLSTDRIVTAVSSLRQTFDENEHRSIAVYHPPVWLLDPLGGSTSPQRLVPPSGSVAGLISRLDRERGAHHTPANAPLYDAVDALQSFDEVDRGRLNDTGVNVIRCFPARGLSVWGGRTLALRRDGRFVAHRRLAHRLVRAIHRLAQPLVFENNGPQLWLTIVRGITSVLLEAWRAGALKGVRPEEAFVARCDADTNPPEERDLGRVTCVIEFAPAAPMEFITLRVALGREGNLEVFEK